MKHVTHHWLELHFDLPRTHKDYLPKCHDYANELTTNNQVARVIDHSIYIDKVNNETLSS